MCQVLLCPSQKLSEFHPQNQTSKVGPVTNPILQIGKPSSKKLWNMSKATQLVSSAATIQISVIKAPNPIPF